MEDFIPTRGSQIKKNAISNYIFVNYETPKKKLKPTDDLYNNKEEKNSKTKQMSAELKEQQEKEMKGLRYDIIKFGMSGFDKLKARRAKVELAVSLGAIPPKNRRTNYKTLKKSRMIEKERKEKEKHTSGFVNSLLKPKSKKVQKKDSGILGIYGKISKGTLPKQKN